MFPFQVSHHSHWSNRSPKSLTVEMYSIFYSIFLKWSFELGIWFKRIMALLESAAKGDFLSSWTTVPLVSAPSAVSHHSPLQKSVNDQYAWSQETKSYANSHFDSSISAFIYLEPLKKQKTKWLFFGGAGICFSVAVTVSLGKELRELGNFRFMFFSKL